ncbi:MAG: SGNH/GDSL hydrolase family protein [Clostridiales bacterium]|nr:SGNH/GDSL hydrolase family protein [Clostridiales bacterium]
MKYVKRIVLSLVFIAGLCGLLLASSRIFVPKSNNKESGTEEVEANGILGERPKSVDGVVLGDSESYSAIIPLQLWKERGYTVYNCGTSGQTLDYSQVMLKRVFSRHKPKVVLMETNAIFRPISRSNMFYTMLCERFSIFRYHNRWKSIDIDGISDSVNYTWTDEWKGYRYSNLVNASSSEGYMSPSEEYADIPEANLDYLKSMKELCDENGTKMILVSTPSTVNWNYKRHNSMKEAAKALDLDYIDLNVEAKEIGIDWTKDTRDKGDHLNYSGAKKVTTYLGQYLQNTGLMKSHLGDPKYESWDAASNKFEDLISRQK